MAYESGVKQAQRANNLSLEGRRRLAVNGVEDVESFDEEQVVLHTTEGALVVKGSELQIGRLSLDTGEVDISGLVNELRYEEIASAGSLWARLFH
ncbi:MAG: sporulation protein YabP [Oscillospiraceae bacterium]|nr:sporulation protein YabP [Oscillospiraceae bacterium]